MIDEDKRISSSEKALLASLRGMKLVKIEAAIASPPNVAWNTVRLRVENYSLDINCFLEQVSINDDGDKDEFGVISVLEADNEALKVPTILAPTEELLINKTISKVELFETSTVAKFNQALFCKKQFTKAIVFHFEDECMVFDKLAWFDEMIRISFGKFPENLLYDESGDWESDEDENGVSFDYSIRKVCL